jgi:peroxiredoxin Q/BCP
MAKPKVGSLAPSFSLENQEGKKITLKEYKGEKNVVLYFYPRALTPGCTVQACGIRDSKKEFSKLNTIVLGISPDPISKLKKFENEKDLNFNILSDEEKEVAKKYGVWGKKKFMGKEYMGILRTTFIISKDGKIKYIMDDVKTKTHHEDVIKLIKEIL